MKWMGSCLIVAMATVLLSGTAAKADLSQQLNDWMKQQGDRGEAAEHAVRYHRSIQQKNAEH